MQVREEEAPERVLVDRVRRDDARRRPEVVPVERAAGLMEMEVERRSRPGRRRDEEREKNRDRARAQAPAERGAGGEDRGGRKRGGHRDREIEQDAGMNAEELPRRRREEMAEIRVRERRAGEPGFGRRELRGPQERVQEREVHRLLARVDLRIQGAHGEEEQERAPEDERRLPALGRWRGLSRPAAAEEAGRKERRRRDGEKASRERCKAPRDEEPGHEREEEDAGDAPEGVSPWACREKNGEKPRAREARELEPRREKEQRDEGRAQAGNPPARLRGLCGRRRRRGRGMREEKIVARESLRRRGRQEGFLDRLGGKPLRVLEEQDFRVVVDRERLVGELVGHLNSQEGRA